jgi:hypothetical protein
LPECIASPNPFRLVHKQCGSSAKSFAHSRAKSQQVPHDPAALIATLTPSVIPTAASRRFFFSFAPAKESAREVEESLCAFFNPNNSLKVSHTAERAAKKFPFFDPAFTLQ